MKKINFLYLILLIFLISTAANGQEQIDNPTYWGAKLHKGVIWAHTSKLEDISDSAPWGVELSWSKINTSKKAWKNCNCYSRVGVSFNYFNFQNPDVLGSSYNLIAFAEPYLNLNDKLYYTIRAGIGPSYLTKVYDEQTNPKNLFFSSPISFIILANFTANYKIAPQWAVNVSAQYSHISNGGIKKPNKGMNFPTFSLGADYIVDPVSLKPREKVISEKGNLQFYGRFFTTRPDVPPTDNLPPSRDWLFGLAAGGQINIANFHGISIGTELVKDLALKMEGERKDLGDDHYIVAAMAGHHLLFGRFDFNQQLGYYLVKPEHYTDHKLYQRYELAYKINEYLLAGVSLKAHAEVAQNFDVRIGVIF
ncbi:MAG: acyloxyacyl hydrolase [Candidatus Cyclobacteriaceae bacterium M2_1C_046]